MKAVTVKNNNPSKRFWSVLAATNVLAIIYPLNLLHNAASSDEKFLAVLALMVVTFLLMVADAISIVIAEVVASTKYSGQRNR